MTPERFFMVGIPSMVARSVERFVAMQGAIQVEIRGNGSWTVQLGRVDQPVVEGAEGAADLHVSFSPEAFEGFVAGKLQVRQAVQQGELSAVGDVTLFEKLGYLLNTGGSPLATRLGLAG